MKAMILAAGMGTRLMPLTETLPKALVPINGKPMLEHLILKLKAAGFREIIINIHHFGDQIIEFLDAHEYFDIKIKISDERDYLLDTGGAIKHAAQLLQGEEPFLVHNVDILSNVDLKALYEHHLETNPLATLLVSKRNTSRYLLFDKQHKLCAWRNRDTGEIKSYFPDLDPKKYEEYAFGGVHVISPKIFEQMEEWTGKFSIINFYLSVSTKMNIQAYPARNISLIDVGNPEGLAKAEKWMQSKI
ncbi:MurNAc alpha-1-phosphate uridylyltransferase [Parabacteroides sp. PF5-5]|uniref:nucleotidyltransferase family protein n=1 Tax=unclassified Parabacteroides TaxID=2649774 RepID=UPI0024759A3D|nr:MULTISPECIES: nucleotidyltransferase family protein [unclassified Parabacteroides]MDH6305359.1 MurNAc alpha-1-phosphate uridylyltransferase [Parabacteroides sp. PH5-39]MDH6316712.1 MurNAc alpha-1-phosphate uridylyltransferase [Parabacteroides sp. PF5-13]MDH6320108.1 MurNAc alpha-1-phosphate uridylyltransferase [Parabacteroides sp. PH5-13]MDH6323949.1 MurNAc alpha-1-phosphate uridylyltransferase [Parabacteroides sp. PH5-8]MDH6327785.1 MurNAc alpha-1-phosphate uridylyltransferase [Parabactero